MGAPIGNTCPDIDNVLSELKSVYDNCISVYDSLEDIVKEDLLSDLKLAFNTLKPYLSKYSSVNPLEHLRECNHELRVYGENLENKYQDALNEIQELEDKINDLQ